MNTAIVLISPLDYESNPIIVCNLNIRGDPNSFRSLVISVEDVNDNIPYFDPSTPNVLSYPEVSFLTLTIDSIRPDSALRTL